MEPETWIIVLGLAWGNPDSRIQAPVGDVLRIERVEVATEAQCKQGAKDWHWENMSGYEYSRAFSTCAGRKP